MKTRLPQLLGICSIVGLCSVGLAAQTAPTAKTAPAKSEQAAAKPMKAAKTAAAATTVTGCVAKSAKHLTLTTDDKTTYDVSGGGIGKHVNHKVEVTGTTSAAKAGGNAMLHAKSIKMVAATCS